MPRIDDPAIANGDALWRRILPNWVVQTPEGGWRPSSAAFLDDLTGEVSVHVARLTHQTTVLEKFPEQSLAEIPAQIPRSLGHIVAMAPRPQDPSHALICPPPQTPKSAGKRDARKMAEQSKWIVLRKP